ncbi:MAG TPA: crossover junction endodeoxyribonuclease RuvC, partial [Planctomycetota bacterium]|nr:crossover junction endodeoxyribonuclease RuvC [Planctomycetota bacterium]
GPYTLDDLIAMTGARTNSARKKLDWLACAAASRARRNAPRATRLIGIDPGTRFVGWGVVDCDAHTRALTLVECGCISPGVTLPLKERLRGIFEELEKILEQTRPHFAALEETFAGVNMKSAIAMGYGRGIALLSLARANLEVLELSPRSIKQSVTGSGAATKSRVASMVAAQLGLKKPPTPEDVTDALAAAIALSQRI